MTDHVPWSCDRSPDDCRDAWCAKHHGELFLCAVCGEGEAGLEPTCPGYAKVAAGELNKVITNNCTPPSGGYQAKLVVGVYASEHLLAASMAMSLANGTPWPPFDSGPLVKALKERGLWRPEKNL